MTNTRAAAAKTASRILARATLSIRETDKELSERLVKVLADELYRYQRGE